MLELLKLRFGEGALQVCEVMLNDVDESQGVDRNIRAGLAGQRPSPDRQLGDRPAEGSDVPTLHAKILSRLFWPDLHDDTFVPPPEVTELQTLYEVGFEKLKQSRKLTWLHALGQATVELDLQDRIVTEECQTWQASVIHAFQSSSNAEDASTAGSDEPTTTRSVDDLVSTLRMPEALVRNALGFWVSKLVLHALSPDVYTVLESLPQAGSSGDAMAAEAQTAAAHTTDLSAAVKDATEKRRDPEKFRMYHQFVVGMLTNGGAMALSQIVGMLGMVVPGGVGASEEELGEWLDGLVEGGTLAFEVGVGRGRYKMG